MSTPPVTSWRISRAVGALLLALVIAAGCSDSGETATPDDPELARGQEVFESNCARCHGPDGGGGVGPKLAEGEVVDNYPDVEDQIAVIVEGRGAMPSWEGQLDPEEIRAVARYTRESL